MLADFRKAFLPTEDEKLAQQELLHKLEQESIDFWKTKGLSAADIEKLSKLEEEEQHNLHKYEYWTSRKRLVEQGIIDLDQVKEELKNL